MEGALFVPVTERMEREGAVWWDGLGAAAREWAARRLMGAAERLAPAVLEDRFRARISAVTMATVTAMMDQQGLARCAECAQRTGLMRVGETLLCATHRAEKKDGGDRE